MGTQTADLMGTQTTPLPTQRQPVVQSTQPSTRRLVRSGALAGAIAAVCTTVVAAIASAAMSVSKSTPTPSRSPRSRGGPSSVPPWASCWPDSFASADGSSSLPQSPVACRSSPRSQLPTTPPPKPFSWGPTCSRRPSSSRLSAGGSAVNNDRSPRGDGTDPGQQSEQSDPGVTGPVAGGAARRAGTSGSQDCRQIWQIEVWERLETCESFDDRHEGFPVPIGDGDVAETEAIAAHLELLADLVD